MLRRFNVNTTASLRRFNVNTTAMLRRFNVNTTAMLSRYQQEQYEQMLHIFIGMVLNVSVLLGLVH